MSRKRQKKKTKKHDDGVEHDPSEVDVDVDVDAPVHADAEPTSEPNADAVIDPPEEVAAAAATEADLQALREENQVLQKGVQELRDLAQRKQAEFENYRKRTERERSDLLRHASSELMLEILPVFDNLGRAVEAAEKGSEDQLREGVGIIYKQFKDILERSGLEEIASEGEPFDPHIHEAVSRVATDELPDGTIVEVFQKGYRLKERLLRPSMVSVSQSAGGARAVVADPESETGNQDANENESEDEVVRHSE